MAETRKLLVAFDPQRPDQPSSDFLIPIQEKNGFILYGLKSGKNQSYGLMIYLGRAITEQDLFSKLMGSNNEIEKPDKLLEGLSQYIETLQSLKIGNVVQLKEGVHDNFELELIAKTPSSIPKVN